MSEQTCTAETIDAIKVQGLYNNALKLAECGSLGTLDADSGSPQARHYSFRVGEGSCSVFVTTAENRTCIIRFSEGGEQKTVKLTPTHKNSEAGIDCLADEMSEQFIPSLIPLLDEQVRNLPAQQIRTDVKHSLNSGDSTPAFQ